MKIKLDDTGRWISVAEDEREEAGWLKLYTHPADGKRENYLLPITNRYGDRLIISVPPIKGAYR